MFQVAIIVAFALGANAFQNRLGRSAEVRVFNFLDSTVRTNGQPVKLSDNTTPFTSSTVAVSTVFGTVETPLSPSTFAATTTPSLTFQTVDIQGTSNTLKLTLSGVAAAVNGVCSATIQPNRRNTIVITQSISGAFVPAATCNAQGQTCNLIDSAAVQTGQVQFTCQVFTEILDTENSCTVDPVAIYRNDDNTCPVFVQRDSVGDITGLGLDDVVLTGSALTSAPVLTNPIVKNFDQTQEFSVNIVGTSQSLFTDAPARQHEVFCGPTNCNAASLKTGFVKIINANFRVSATNILQNNYQISIESANKNVHFVANLGAGQQTPSQELQYIELPLTGASTTFTVKIYFEATATTIFGVKGTTPIAPTATALQTSTFSLTSDEYAAIVLSGVSTPTVTKISLSDVVPNVASTNYKLVNLIDNFPLEFASPSDDCCNFLEFADTTSILNPGATNARSVSTDTIGATVGANFNSYFPNAPCTSLLASLVQPSLISLNDASSASTCVSKVIFLTGRRSTRTVTTSGAGTSCSSCDTTVTFVSPITSPVAGTANSIGKIEVSVPLCGCAGAVAVAPTCDVCEKDEFDDLSAKVDAVTASITAVRSSITALSNNVDTDSSSIIKQVKKVGNDLEDELDDVNDDLEDELKKIRKLL